MALTIIIADEALADLDREALHIAEFSPSAALELYLIFRAKTNALTTNPERYRIFYRSAGLEFRRFFIKSRTIVFHLAEGVIFVDRVFGPGQDWPRLLAADS